MPSIHAGFPGPSHPIGGNAFVNDKHTSTTKKLAGNREFWLELEGGLQGLTECCDMTNINGGSVTGIHNYNFWIGWALNGMGRNLTEAMFVYYWFIDKLNH